MTRDIYFLDLMLVVLLGMDLFVFSATPLCHIALREPDAQFDYVVVVVPPPAMRTVKRTVRRRMTMTMTTTTRNLVWFVVGPAVPN